MAHDVFISYAKEDQQFADVICERLERSRVKCWIASRKEKLVEGLNWPEQIVHAINESQVVIFILSHHSNKSPYVLRELMQAVEGGLHIITFRIEAVHPSDQISFYVRGLQWLDAYPDPSDIHYKRILDALGKLFSRGSPKRSEEYEKELQTIAQFLESSQWNICICRCVEQFEKALKQLLKGLIISISGANGGAKANNLKKFISECKERTFEALTLADLVALYTQAEVFSELRTQLTSTLYKVNEIDWDRVLRISEAVRDEKNCSAQGEEAEQMFQWLRILFYGCKLMPDDTRDLDIPEQPQKHVLNKCSQCGQYLTSNWRYCPMCGVSLILVCEGCRMPLGPDYKICPYCETRVNRMLRNNLSDEERVNEEHRIREEYATLCKGAYLDEIVNTKERQLLEKKRLELGLSNEEAEEIERRCAPRKVWEFMRLVQGALVDGRIDDREESFLNIKSQELDVDPDIANIIIKVETARRNNELF